MKERSARRKQIKREGGLNHSRTSKKTQCQEKITVSPTEPPTNKSPLPEHLVDYNDIVIQLIKRKAQYLSPYENNSSYVEWAKTQDKLAFYQASSSSKEDVLKARIQLTRQKFIENLNWKTLDVINYLISSHSDVNSPKSNESIKENLTAQRNPIVLTASLRKQTKAGLIDVSKPGGTGKPTSKKPPTAKSAVTIQAPTDREPPFPKKYNPTYKLSNYDFVKKGWTKLPDYSITYRYYTLGTEPAFPALWAFKTRTDGRREYYPNSIQLSADFEGEKPHYIFYPNGEVAISISDGRVGPRLIVYSMSRKDDTGRWIDSRPQAMFDSKGNGVVYDLEGRMRMNFDQIEGAMYSFGKNVRPALHWYWKESTFLRIRRDDLSAVPPDHNDDIDPTRPEGDSRKSRSSRARQSTKKKSRNETSGVKRKSKTARKSKSGTKEKGARKSRVSRKSKVGGQRKSKTTFKEVKNKGVKTAKSEKTQRKTDSSRKSQTGGKSRRRSLKKSGGSAKRSTRVDVPPIRKKPRHPKPITEIAPLAIKITDYVSMRIMSQQHIHLDFECGTVHHRLYLGVNVKPETVERIDRIVNPKKVENITPCYFELMPLRSMSLYNVNKKLQEMRKEAARREYKKNIRSLGGFYAWWLKKKRVAFEKKQNQKFLLPLGPNKMP